MLQKRYDPFTNRFDDDCSIDWFITEKPETAWLCSEDFLGPMSDAKHRDARVDFCRDGELHITAPISRYWPQKYLSFSVKADCTVMTLLTSIYEFYHQQIDKEWLKIHRSETPDLLDSYHSDAIDRCEDGGTMKLVELLGGLPADPEADEEQNSIQRRHPLMCSGLVRYEGVHSDYKLMLGS